MRSEVAVSLRRAVAQKNAAVAVNAEQAAQIADPRRPSAEVAASIVGVVENIDSLGARCSRCFKLPKWPLETLHDLTPSACVQSNRMHLGGTIPSRICFPF
jgi:hypothetical protein